MKKALILLTVLGLLATPVMAKQQQLEASPVQKHASAKVKKHAAKKEKKHAKKKLAKRNTRKHKITV